FYMSSKKPHENDNIWMHTEIFLMHKYCLITQPRVKAFLKPSVIQRITNFLYYTSSFKITSLLFINFLVVWNHLLEIRELNRAQILPNMIYSIERAAGIGQHDAIQEGTYSSKPKDGFAHGYNP
ncbi:hypothetical protein ACJX0J_025901, partial [Zea mays]